MKKSSKVAQIEYKLGEMYDQYLDATTLVARERISSEIHNLEVKLMQLNKPEKTPVCSGILECSTLNSKGYAAIY